MSYLCWLPYPSWFAICSWQRPTCPLAAGSSHRQPACLYQPWRISRVIVRWRIVHRGRGSWWRSLWMRHGPATVEHSRRWCRHRLAIHSAKPGVLLLLHRRCWAQVWWHGNAWHCASYTGQRSGRASRCVWWMSNVQFTVTLRTRAAPWHKVCLKVLRSTIAEGSADDLLDLSVMQIDATVEACHFGERGDRFRYRPLCQNLSKSQSQWHQRDHTSFPILPTEALVPSHHLQYYTAHSDISSKHSLCVYNECRRVTCDSANPYQARISSHFYASLAQELPMSSYKSKVRP